MNKQHMIYVIVLLLIVQNSHAMNTGSSAHPHNKRGIGYSRHVGYTEEEELRQALKAIKQSETQEEAELKAALEAIRQLEVLEAAVNEKTVTNEKKEEKKDAKQCGICLEEGSEPCSLACGHEYCNGCLEGMVDTAIHDKNTKILKCAACPSRLTQSDIEKITKDPTKRAALERIVRREASRELATVPGMKACPTPDCDWVFSNEQNRAQDYRCPMCQQQYCAACLLKHEPQTSCQAVKAENDAQNEAWKAAHTKPCPVCSVPCERIKNQDGSWAACNHMTCHKGHEFCWDCSRLTKRACACILVGYGVIP